jgi:acetyl-CoA synthetase
MGLREVLPTSILIFPEYRDNVKILREIHGKSLNDPESFWRKIADDLHWYEKKGHAFEAVDQPPYGRWFPDWKTNISHNALDRQVSGPGRDKVAYHWEGENGDKRKLTYNDLYIEVNRFASAPRNSESKREIESQSTCR